MSDSKSISRRSLLASALALPSALIPGLARAVEAQKTPTDSTLVCVFLRGAVDGLSLVVPYAEAAYYRERPSLAIARPGQASGAIRLDPRFGLHPRLAALKPAYDAGELAWVHAVGSPHPTRSHFEAQDYMESATPGQRRDEGWLGRYLADSEERGPNAISAVAVSKQPPLALRGDPSALIFPELGRFELRAPKRFRDRMEGAFSQMYAGAEGGAARAGLRALTLTRRLRDVHAAHGHSASGVVYPKPAAALRDVATLIKAEAGLSVAWIDLGGWDTHQAQGNAENGRLAPLLDNLGKGLSAFRKDLGPRLERVLVLVMTEFGRTAKENGTGGTDHGHGSVMLLLGGRVRGRKVYGSFPGLDPEALYEGRDLAVTTDFRDVFAEVATKHLGASNLDALLPHFTPNPLNSLGILR